MDGSRPLLAPGSTRCEFMDGKGGQGRDSSREEENQFFPLHPTCQSRLPSLHVSQEARGPSSY